MNAPYTSACVWVHIRPFVSVVTLLNVETERKEATAMKIMASAKCLPGQIRFPNPNIVDTTGSSRKLPSGLMNRSGLKESGSGYMIGS